MSKGTRTNWLAARSEFVHGLTENGVTRFPTLQEIAERYGVTASWVRQKAALEKWSDAQSRQRALTEQMADAKRVAILSTEAAEFDSRTFKIANAGIALIARGVAAAQQSADANGKPKPADAALLVKLGTALRHYQAVGRIALGLSADNAAAAMVNVNQITVAYEDMKLGEVIDQ